MRTIKFNAPAHHVFKVGDVEMHGGETADVDERTAERALTSPHADITDVTDAAEPDALDSYSRSELEEIAAQAGVESPEELPNKDAVKAAIRETAEATG